MPERPKVVVVQCVCGRLKQQGFICDYCYSTADTRAQQSDGYGIHRTGSTGGSEDAHSDGDRL